MAAADYRLCDVCDGKVFYDANLNYEQGRASKWAKRQAPFRWAGEEQGKPENDDWLLRLDYLGDWAVICDDCAKTHKTTVVPIESAPAEPIDPHMIVAEDRFPDVQVEPIADSDADYWLRNRQAILDAIERAGFMLMSNASGFWLHPRGKIDAQAKPKREPLSDEQMRAVLIAEARRIAAQADRG
jgi:hypothetical protein